MRHPRPMIWFTRRPFPSGCGVVVTAHKTYPGYEAGRQVACLTLDEVKRLDKYAIERRAAVRAGMLEE